ncbi:MAG: flagellar biosynthesis anti-sigma factor FlgM [Oscillospiraceae bacterium]|nr:flagellar biosynthesis anti-sigma factor FlgM [Oscillospiraceae bacterium]
MKIDVTGGYGIYRGQKSGEPAKAKGEAASGNKSGKATDIAEFSHGNTAIADKAFVSLKSAIQRDINAPASPERLAELRAEVKNGTYRVPVEALVDAILGE